MEKIFCQIHNIYDIETNPYIKNLKRLYVKKTKFINSQIQIYYFYDILTDEINKYLKKNNNDKINIVKEYFNNNIKSNIFDKNINTDLYYYLNFIGFNAQKLFIFNNLSSYNIYMYDNIKKIGNEFSIFFNESNIDEILIFLIIIQYLLNQYNNYLYLILKNFDLNQKINTQNYLIKDKENIQIYIDLLNKLNIEYNENLLEKGLINAIRIFDKLFMLLYDRLNINKLYLCDK